MISIVQECWHVVSCQGLKPDRNSRNGVFTWLRYPQSGYGRLPPNDC